MSQENAKKFFDAADKDSKIQDELKAAGRNIAEVGAKHGFKFTPKDLRDHLQERFKVAKPHKFDDPDTCTL